MERAHKYEFEGKVRYSEIDHRATMTLPALINYFQDCILAGDCEKVSEAMRKDHSRNICFRF